MGCASSKTSSWVVTYGVGGGECKSITQISLSANATLKEVRQEIDLDANDGVQGIPANFGFRFPNGLEVPARKEKTLKITDVYTTSINSKREDIMRKLICICTFRVYKYD